MLMPKSRAVNKRFEFNGGIVPDLQNRPASVVYPTERSVWASISFGATVWPANRRVRAVGKRILIADDGEEVRQVLRAMFEARTDYEICGEAANGAEAVSKALELKPDLILLDVAMPMLNGVEVASVLAGSMPDLPIVLYTMYSDMLGSRPSYPKRMVLVNSSNA